MRRWIGKALLGMTLAAPCLAADRPTLQSAGDAERLSKAAADSAGRVPGDSEAGDSEDRSRGQGTRAADADARRTVTAEFAGAEDEADAATLAFVREYQPELANLLQYLRSKRSSDYGDALKEIRRVRERLENLKKRDRELHDVELALWQNSAQLRLWAASVSASGKRLDVADRNKLAELVTRENELTTRRLTLEKARTEARLEQLNQQLNKRQAQSESLISRGIKTWESRIERPNANAKAKAEFGARPRMLDAEATLALTGHEVGGVCPFGLATPLPVYCDVSLQPFATVFPAAGSRNASVEISPERLFALVGERWVDACTLPEEAAGP